MMEDFIDSYVQGSTPSPTPYGQGSTPSPTSYGQRPVTPRSNPPTSSPPSSMGGESPVPGSCDTTTSSLYTTEDDIITVEQITDVEATPFYPDGTESLLVSPDMMDPFGVRQPPAKHVTGVDPAVVTRLQVDVEDNRAVVQELRTALSLIKGNSEMRRGV